MNSAWGLGDFHERTRRVYILATPHVGRSGFPGYREFAVIVFNSYGRRVLTRDAACRVAREVFGRDAVFEIFPGKVVEWFWRKRTAHKCVN